MGSEVGKWIQRYGRRMIPFWPHSCTICFQACWRERDISEPFVSNNFLAGWGVNANLVWTHPSGKCSGVQVTTRLVPWNCQIKGESTELEFFHILHCLNTWTFFSSSVFISSLMPWNIYLKSRQEANKERPLNSPVLHALGGKKLRLRQSWVEHPLNNNGLQRGISDLRLTLVEHFWDLERLVLVCLGMDLGSCVWW